MDTLNFPICQPRYINLPTGSTRSSHASIYIQPFVHSTRTYIINPWHMHKGYGSHSVCVSVCYHASCYIPHLRVQTAVLPGSLWHSERMI